MPCLGIFRLQFENNILVFEISTPEFAYNLQNMKNENP